ncbi:MAG: amidohydrolase family protein [Eubacteriales bacterium]|nr:amidohydrolase family protein [Eubacteriales bacterium]
MNSIKVTDSHVHFWDPNNLKYEWLEGNPQLNRPFVVKDYLEAVQGINIEKILFVQADCSPDQFEEEVKWVSALADKDKVIKGIIAYAPIEEGSVVQSSIERVCQYPLVKGVRRLIQFEPDIDFCVQPKFIEGVRVLEKYNLSFDLCISHIQMENTIKLVQNCPRIHFILDHIGKPDIKNQIFELWKKHLKVLSKMHNVSCKISGLVTEAAHYQWKADDLKPCVDHVINSFGFDRVMYGGDWPVIRMASQYSAWFDALKKILAGYSEEERRKLYFENANRIYNLK